jgi:hypothetical protein
MDCDIATYVPFPHFWDWPDTYVFLELQMDSVASMDFGCIYSSTASPLVAGIGELVDIVEPISICATALPTLSMSVKSNRFILTGCVGQRFYVGLHTSW